MRKGGAISVAGLRLPPVVQSGASGCRLAKSQRLVELPCPDNEVPSPGWIREFVDVSPNGRKTGAPCRRRTRRATSNEADAFTASAARILLVRTSDRMKMRRRSRSSSARCKRGSRRRPCRCTAGCICSRSSCRRWAPCFSRRRNGAAPGDWRSRRLSVASSRLAEPPCLIAACGASSLGLSTALGASH